MTETDIKMLAMRLYDARKNATGIEQISHEFKEMTQLDAYKLQWLGIDMRVADGEKVIGLKMGLTSEAKRKQMDLDSPLYGVLTDKMQVANNGEYSMEGQIHPKIEPEVAFLIGKDLNGTPSREEILDAVEAVYPCMEILDSRYKQFKYFSMEDVISDNSSSSQFILGEPINDFKNINLAQLKMKMSINGTVAQEGMTDAISGDPVISLVQQFELLAKTGKTLPAGSIVLAGAATPAVALEPGMEISLEVESLGNVAVKVNK
tara:strand:+ start:23942 stop:24727 length:786 start_codon:yes stop_codon:yes gene_type:complete